MNYSQIRAFHAVASHGSFTRAAEKLHISQPTVSDHVRSFENHYQVELFERHGREIRLTGLGRTLFEVTTRMFSLEAECELLLTTARGLLSGSLRVAADSPYLIMPMLGAFNRQYPGIELSLSIGNASEVAARLLQRSCDIAVMPDMTDDKRIYRETLREDRISCLVEREHAWAGRKILRLQELQGKSLVMREKGSYTRACFERALQHQKVQPGSVLEVGSREAVREAVAAGLGVGVISESEFGSDNRLHILQVRHDELRVFETLACLNQARELPVVKAFFSMIRRTKE